MMSHTILLLALLTAPVAAAQTWLTDPAFGARRDAYGPGVHSDATGRPYRDNVPDAWLREPVERNAYGLGVGADRTGRAVVPDFETTAPEGGDE